MMDLKEITDETEARQYIKYFCSHVVKGANHICYASGEKVMFDDMTAQQAIFAANDLRDMEIEAAKRFRGVKQ